MEQVTLKFYVPPTCFEKCEMLVSEIKAILPMLLRHKNMWSDYDKEADTQYVHFKKPNHADHTELTDDDIIIRTEKGEIVGLTILHASTRTGL